MSEITRTTEIPAPPGEVWESVTNPERLGRWLGGTIDLEPVPHRPFSFDTGSGSKSGFVIDVIPERILEFWWAAPTDASGTLVRIELTPTTDGTAVRVIETPAAVTIGPIGSTSESGRIPTQRIGGGRMTQRDRAHVVFAALADATRRDVLQRISSLGSATATELAEDLPVTRQAVVKHLSTLDAAGLVEGHRTGREVRYQVTPAPMEDAVEWISGVGAQWDDRLARLRDQF